MSSLFKKSSGCPIDAVHRTAINDYFLWLIASFGKEQALARPVLVPDANCFPVQYDGSKDSVEETLAIVAGQMEISISDIALHFYHEGDTEVNTGNSSGQKLPLGNSKYSSGVYWGKNEEGKYQIGIEMKLVHHPEKMVATMAHELAHIKLLGEERLPENDEALTDFTTVLFGLGIFNANAAFNERTETKYRIWSRLGYLSQMEWGYALAIFAIMREADDLAWQKYLTPNVRSDMDRSMEHLLYANDEEAHAFLTKLKNA